MNIESLGIGAMIGILSGNKDSVEAFTSSVGKTITALELTEADDGSLLFTFDDGTKMEIADEGRSCCESRYMTTDDDLQFHVGAKLLGAEVAEGPDVEEDYESHEMEFLKVKTTRGVFTVETHNEHNGYYGGFCIRASMVTP